MHNRSVKQVIFLLLVLFHFVCSVEPMTDKEDMEQSLISFSESRVKRIDNADQGWVEDYPCMAVVTKADKVTGKYRSLDGVLITMEWFLSTTSLMDELAGSKNKGWKIKAGGNSKFPHSSDNISDVIKVVHYKREELDHQLSLVKCTPALVSIPNDTIIEPAKLPPSVEFSSKCTKVIIVGWGYYVDHYDIDMNPSDFRARLLSASDGKIVKCPRQKQNSTARPALPNHFCLELVDPALYFSSYDIGLSVFCDNDTSNDTLIGIVLEPYGEALYTNSKTAKATNISQYMTWLKETTGVKVAFESKPIYTPTTTTTTTARSKSKTVRYHANAPDNEEESNPQLGSGADLKADLWIVIEVVIVVFLQRNIV